MNKKAAASGEACVQNVDDSSIVASGAADGTAKDKVLADGETSEQKVGDIAEVVADGGGFKVLSSKENWLICGKT